MLPPGEPLSGPQAGALCPRLPGIPEESLPRPGQPHPQQAPHPAGGQTQRTRHRGQLWEGPICMAILPPQAVGGIKEPRGAVSAERLEGGTQGIPPPWPEPLYSSASLPTAQVTGSSGFGDVAPVGPRALFFTPGAQAVGWTHLLAQVPGAGPSLTVPVSFFPFCRVLGTIRADPGGLRVTVSGSVGHPHLHWEQQQRWILWRGLVPTPPRCCPQNRGAGKFSTLRPPSPALGLLFWLHHLTEHLWAPGCGRG